MSLIRYFLKGLLILISSFIFTSNLAFAKSLHIYQARTGESLKCLGVGDTFSLSFIHSVSLTPVIDVYRIEKDNKIVQIREDFITHGQGLPSMENEPDMVKFEITKKGYSLHLKREIKQLIVRTDRRFKNRLLINKPKNKKINLNQWADTSLYLKPVEHCF